MCKILAWMCFDGKLVIVECMEMHIHVLTHRRGDNPHGNIVIAGKAVGITYSFV